MASLYPTGSATFGPGRPASGLLSPVKPQSSVEQTWAAPARVRGLVQIWSPETGMLVAARHWERPQVTQERAGGWSEVARINRLPVTQWDGPRALKVRLVLFVDGYDQQPKRPVDRELDGLRSFGYRDPKLGRPPVVQVVGAVPYADGGVLDSHRDVPPNWVVENLEVEELLSTSSGKPCRAKVTVDLLEYAPADSEVRRARTSKSRKYKWRKGDTLRGVATRELGSPDRSALIRQANPKVKWGSIAAGTTIVLPGVSR